MPPSNALHPHQHPYQFGGGVVLLVLAIPLLWFAGLPTALPPQVAPGAWLPYWQLVADILAVALSALIFITGYHAILSPRKDAVVLLGVSFLGVGLLTLLDLVSHIHLTDSPGLTSSTATLWFGLLARLVLATALLVYVTLPAVGGIGTQRKRMAIALVAGSVALLVALIQQHPTLLPQLTDENGQATALLHGLQHSIVALHLVAVFILWIRRDQLENECLMALLFAAALSAIAGLLYALAPAPFDAGAHATADLYQILALLYLFHATFNEALHRPLDRLEMLYRRENATLSAAPDGVLWVDREGTIALANPAMLTLSGYAPEELIGQNISLFLPPYLREKHALSMLEYFHNPRSRAMGLMDLRLYRKDGTQKPVDISLGYWEVDGQPHAIAYLRDLTERKQMEESLRHQATHDELTGLPNRWLFQLQLRQALLRVERNRQRVAVLFLDLDHFKTINDTFGHSVGDALLTRASQRIQGTLRASDLLARMGGDEFAILLPDLAHPDEAVTVAVKILNCLQEAFDLPEQSIYTGGSVGLAYYPDDASDIDTLLRYADMAMYQAKQSGRGSYACYSQELDRRTHEDMLLYARLKVALADQLLSLHFQPQIRLRDGSIIGAEALLRWNDPVLGQVGPDRFIPLAETTGLILPLSDWVLETACRQIAAWQHAGTPTRLAVNISAHQLQHGQLAEKIRSLLARTGAHAQWLDLEITESVAMSQPRQALEQLNTLVALGCSVSLDDFGTGYSSLAYLKTLPVSKIKVDKSFVQDITDDPNDDVIVQTIIGMAHNLGLKVVAEGVETDAQRDRLDQYGCDTCQGYLFHHPLPLGEFEQLLRAPTPQLERPMVS